MDNTDMVLKDMELGDGDYDLKSNLPNLPATNDYIKFNDIFLFDKLPEDNILLENSIDNFIPHDINLGMDNSSTNNNILSIFSNLNLSHFKQINKFYGNYSDYIPSPPLSYLEIQTDIDPASINPTNCKNDSTSNSHIPDNLKVTNEHYYNNSQPNGSFIYDYPSPGPSVNSLDNYFTHSFTTSDKASSKFTVPSPLSINSSYAKTSYPGNDIDDHNIDEFDTFIGDTSLLSKLRDPFIDLITVGISYSTSKHESITTGNAYEQMLPIDNDNLIFDLELDNNCQLNDLATPKFSNFLDEYLGDDIEQNEEPVVTTIIPNHHSCPYSHISMSQNQDPLSYTCNNDTKYPCTMPLSYFHNGNHESVPNSVIKNLANASLNEQPSLSNVSSRPTRSIHSSYNNQSSFSPSLSYTESLASEVSSKSSKNFNNILGEINSPKLKKKIQNKFAAAKYRLKKKEESQNLVHEERDLITDNRCLKNKVNCLAHELEMLKQLLK
ncbi:unnamed protein product [Gordionus sp. m RMFG-2023]